MIEGNPGRDPGPWGSISKHLAMLNNTDAIFRFYSHYHDYWSTSMIEIAYPTGI